MTTTSAEASGRPSAPWATPGACLMIVPCSRGDAGIELGLRAAAQHERDVLAARGLQRRLEALRHREQRREHGDDAREADDDDERRTEPLRNAADAERR